MGTAAHHVQKNDVLTLTAVLHPGIPPNDLNFCTQSGLFPGLFVYIAYNNGSNPTVIFRDTLEVPMNFGPLVLSEDNGTLYATVRCVTADLTVNLETPGVQKWTPSQVQLGQKWALRFQGTAILTGAAALGCRYIPGQWGILCGTGFGLATLAMQASAFGVNLILQDPSDPNFTVIAQPVPIVLPTGMDCGDFPECNSLVGNFLQIISLNRAIGTTNDRIQGAVDAGDTYWQTQQQQARQQYQHQLALLVSQNATLLENFQYAVQARTAAAGAMPMTLSAADIAT